MPDDNSHLKTILRTNAVETSAPDDDNGLPSLRDGQYQPYARPVNKAIHAIHIVNPKGEVRSFQYVHLDSDARFEGERIVLRFMGMEPIQVAIHGRNLWRLYDYIHQHRIPWVMVASSDFEQDGRAIITRVSFAPIRDSDPVLAPHIR